MNEPNFTPGPWEANTFLVVAPKSHDSMSRMYGGKSICHTGCVGNSSTTECEANARLIAAAPDMYAVLKKLASHRGLWSPSVKTITDEKDAAAQGILDGCFILLSDALAKVEAAQ